MCYNRLMKHGHTNSIIVYTDGSSLGNPGSGGYGCVLVFLESDKVVELGGHAHDTTNNKMELTAIITTLEYLKKNHVSPDAKIVIHTDSSYAINGITKWVFGWQKNNWITSTKAPVLNSDLWKQLIPLTGYFKNLKFDHVRGHAGIWGNERCDMIATSFASNKKIDLFHGELLAYDPRVLSKDFSESKHTTKNHITVSQKSKSTKTSGKAYSYVALVNGKIQTFSDWESCKAVVHGRSAKYKKVLSKQDEEALIQEWSK